MKNRPVNNMLLFIRARIIRNFAAAKKTNHLYYEKNITNLIYQHSGHQRPTGFTPRRDKGG